MSPMPPGANVALTKEVPGLSAVVVGVDWDARGDRTLHDSLTLLTVLCGPDRRALSDDHLVHLNQLVSADLSTAQLEQALGDDDVQVEVDLAAVPPEVERVVVLLTVNDDGGARRTLGQLGRLVVGVSDLANGARVVTSEDLAPPLQQETALGLVELYRRQGEWKLRVLGSGYSGGLPAVARDYGVSL